MERLLHRSASFSDPLRVGQLDPAVALIRIGFQQPPAILLVHDGVDSGLDIAVRGIGSTRSIR